MSDFSSDGSLPVGRASLSEKDDATITITQPLSAAIADGQLKPAQSSYKVEQIRRACCDRDCAALVTFAKTEGGLLDDDVRREAWPLLLGYDDGRPERDSDWVKLPKHRDEEQVDLDVNRSFVYYPENEPQQRIEARKRELSDLIVGVLRRHPLLCYFQGYHDIIQVFLLVLGKDIADQTIARLSLLRIRDFMLPTLAGAETHLHLLPAILMTSDPDLCRHLSGASKPTPFFALAATLTLYAHDIEEYGDIARLFDYLLASEAAVPVYLFAVIVMSRKKELLEVEPDEPEMLHSILSKLPKPLDLEGLIQKTQTLFERHPPKTLPYRVWSRINSNSVLKTTQSIYALSQQSTKQGEELFLKQAAEIRRQERRKQLGIRVNYLFRRYKRPAGFTGAAVIIAVIALYFGRPPTGTDWLTTAFATQQRLWNTARSLMFRS